MLHQNRSDRRFDHRIGVGIEAPQAVLHRVDLVGKRFEQGSEGRPVDVQRGQSIVDKELAAAGALRLQAVGQEVEDLGASCRRLRGALRGVQIFTGATAEALDSSRTRIQDC